MGRSRRRCLKSHQRVHLLETGYWTQMDPDEFLGAFEVLEKNGGEDVTPTRGLCRVRVSIRGNS